MASRRGGPRPGPDGVVHRGELVRRLGTAARLTMVSAPAGSGKTVLLRSWAGGADLAERVAWVTVGLSEADPQRFWVSVIDSLRQTGPGSVLVRELTPAPDLDGWAIVERLLKDLAALDEAIWLVVDDLQELDSAEARQQLVLLLMRSPPGLRFVLATRQDMRLGLHRLRLEGEVADIRGADLRFSLAEARQMFASAGIELPEPALAVLHERTEGWAAGLRLAALSLTGHHDPGRFVVEFSGSERTVAEYLLAEVLDRQSQDVRRLLLRTSILERVTGELADLLTGRGNGQRILQDLEQANAFVAALDTARTWFRYHQMFADLLQLELRRTEPDQVTALHQLAASWHAAHGYPVEAVRHAQAAQEWGLAARLLADHWPALQLDGQAATAHQLLAGFPAEERTADPELAGLLAADELEHGSLELAERFMELAASGMASVPARRHAQMQVLLGINRLGLARQHSDPRAMFEEARRMQALAEAPDAARLGLSEELRALALISIGQAEFMTVQIEEAERHLDQSLELAYRTGRPFLEFTGLMLRAALAAVRLPFAPAVQYALRAVELAEQHGWTDEPPAGIAYTILAAGLTWKARFGEAESWIQRAERTFRPQVAPAEALAIHFGRSMLELMRGRYENVVAEYRATERLVSLLAAPNNVLARARATEIYALVRMGETERAEQSLAAIGEEARAFQEIVVAAAALRLAQGSPAAAASVLGPVLDESAPVPGSMWLVHAFVLEAAARDRLGDPGAAERALERALDLAEADHTVVAFLLYPARELIERYAPSPPAHADLIAEILGLLPRHDGHQARPGEHLPVRHRSAPAASPWLADPLSQSEARVLRYLPTHLTVPEMARELSVSASTVRTHIRHLFAKLGAHSRTEAVAQARALGLLAPSPRTP